MAGGPPTMTPARRSPETTEALRVSLINHARDLVSTEGPVALTMRALAERAGCATGLPYKVFTDRNELVLAVLHAEFERLGAASSELIQRAGTGTVAGNLTSFAELLLDSPGVALAPDVMTHEPLTKSVTAQVHDTGIGPGAFETGFASYLEAEKRAGRVDASIDSDAFGFVLAGAVHNLVVSGDAWPRPTRRQLRKRLAAVAAALAPRS